jgi:hypothetical protein
MPTRKPKDDDYKDKPPRDPRKPHEEHDNAVKVHEAYLQHRLGGGEPASPEAYRRALEQFEKLPGAMRSTPVPVRPKEEGGKPERDPGEEGNEGGSR